MTEKNRENFGVLTPERKLIFDAMMQMTQIVRIDVQKVRDLAQCFEDEGLTEQAQALRERATLLTTRPFQRSG